MTLCEKCRQFMRIVSTVVDFGDGDEEFEFEACTTCKIIYVYGDGDWTVRLG